MDIQRRHFYVADLDDPYRLKYDSMANRIEVEPDKANLISSQLKGGYTHAPVLDLDFEARLVPSRTPGHHHLYLDIEMTWPTYRGLLAALAKAKIIEDGYCRASIDHQQSFVRVPGGSTLEARLLKRAVEAEHRVAELEDEIVGLKELITKLATRG